jgi:hypothetical protein
MLGGKKEIQELLPWTLCLLLTLAAGCRKNDPEAKTLQAAR